MRPDPRGAVGIALTLRGNSPIGGTGPVGKGSSPSWAAWMPLKNGSSKYTTRLARTGIWASTTTTISSSGRRRASSSGRSDTSSVRSDWLRPSNGFLPTARERVTTVFVVLPTALLNSSTVFSSERTEEVALLPEDEARRLPLDEIVVVVDAQMPVRAKRVVYYEDPFFKGIHAAQEGDLPFPKGPVPPMGELPLSVRAMPSAPRGSGLTERDFEARMGITEPGGNSPIDPGSAQAPRRGRAAVLADDQRQLEMEFGRQADLEVVAATEDDVVRVQDAVSDLERLEAEMSGSEPHVGEAGEKFGLG